VQISSHSKPHFDLWRGVLLLQIRARKAVSCAGHSRPSSCFGGAMSFLSRFVSFARASRRRGFRGAAMVSLALSACDFDLIDQGDCKTDSDCPAKSDCIVGWFGGTCTPRCSSNADCDSKSFCSTQSLAPHCLTGCRDSSDCSETEWCDNGFCAIECANSAHGCDRGRPGSICVGVSTTASGAIESGFCSPSCESDADCKDATHKECICGSCAAPCNAETCGANVCRATQTCPTPRCLPSKLAPPPP